MRFPAGSAFSGKRGRFFLRMDGVRNGMGKERGFFDNANKTVKNG